MYGYYVGIIGLIVILMLSLQFLFVNAGAFLALILGVYHYQDNARFCRCISGVGDIYFTMANILIRNFIILHIFDKMFILRVATFNEEITNLQYPSFFAVIYQVISAELFIMDILLLCKMAVS